MVLAFAFAVVGFKAETDPQRLQDFYLAPKHPC